MTANEACQIAANRWFKDDVIHKKIRSQIDMKARAAAMDGCYHIDVVICEKHNPKLIMESLLKDGFRVGHKTKQNYMVNGLASNAEEYHIEW